MSSVYLIPGPLILCLNNIVMQLLLHIMCLVVQEVAVYLARVPLDRIELTIPFFPLLGRSGLVLLPTKGCRKLYRELSLESKGSRQCAVRGAIPAPAAGDPGSSL